LHTVTVLASSSIKESLQATLGFRIWTVVVLIDDLLEYRSIRISVREEGHRGTQLDRVDAAEDVLGAESTVRSDDLGTLDEPRPEYRMGEIGLRFRQIAERVRLSRGTAPEPCDLRKDEPHPVTGLAPVSELCDGVLVRAAAGLRFDKTLEVHVPDVSARRGTL
jgi:hypothetical protein